jgi:hypothetical protein
MEYTIENRIASIAATLEALVDTLGDDSAIAAVETLLQHEYDCDKSLVFNMPV